jgi:hypothetical protein
MSKELLEKIWWSRNPQHEVNADTGKDMFFDTVKMVIDDYNAALKISSKPMLADSSRQDDAWNDLGNTLYEMGNEEPQW